MLWRFGEFDIDTDPNRIDYERVYDYLRTTYWASDRSFSEIRAAWERSHPVFVYTPAISGLFKWVRPAS